MMAVLWQLVTLLSMTGGTSGSETCRTPGVPFVEVAAGAGVASAIADEVTKRLAIELQAGSVAACREGTTTGMPLARVSVRTAEVPGSFVLEVRDLVTHKTTVREESLAYLPESARVVALGLAAAELVMASWAEVLLRPPEVAAGPRVGEVIAVVNAAKSPARFRASVMAAGERFSGGHVHYGADLLASVSWAARLRIYASAGVRASTPLDGQNGRAHMNAVEGGTGIAVRVAGDERFGCGLRGGLDLVRVWAWGEPGPGAEALSQTSWALVVPTMFASWVALSANARLVVEVGVVTAVRAVRARDDNASIGGIEGVAPAGALGLEVAF